jgi:hypothetical protein
VSLGTFELRAWFRSKGSADLFGRSAALCCQLNVTADLELERLATLVSASLVLYP